MRIFPQLRPARLTNALFFFLWANLTFAALPNSSLNHMSYQTWDQSNGLPQISVNDMVFGPQGRLWVGTERGLARFDGNTFTPVDILSHPAFKANWITRLFSDNNKRLWIGTIKNLAVLENGQFKAVTTATNHHSGRINDITQTKDGDLWFAADTLLKLEQDHLAPVQGWQGSPTALLSIENRVWVASQSRLSLLENGTWQHFDLPEKWHQTRITGLAYAQNTLWLGTSNGLLTFINGQFGTIPLPQDKVADLYIRNIVADDDDVLLSTYSSFYRLRNKKVIEHLESGDASFLPRAMRILPERNGVWIASLTEGLRHYWADNAVVYSTKDNAPDNLVWSMTPAGNNVLFGTAKGVGIWQQGTISTFIEPDDLPDPIAYSLLTDSQKRVWVGTFHGLARYSETGQLQHTYSSLSQVKVNGMLEDNRHRIWIATADGLYRINEDKVHKFGDSDGLTETAFRAILEISDDEMWIGSENGLFRYSKGTFTRVNEPELKQVLISSLALLNNGNLAVGTYDHGLYIYGRDGWTRYTQQNNLPITTAFSLEVYADQLVVSTPDGVYSIWQNDLKEHPNADYQLPLRFLLYDPGRRPGRSTIRCCNGMGNGKSALLENDAFFPSSQGLVKIDLANAGAALPHANFDVYHWDDKKLPVNANNTLPVGERRMYISYSANDFRDGPLLNYRYRIVGLNEHWRDIGEKRSIDIENLPVGQIEFEVQARRPFEAWGPTATARFTVPPRFTETLTFEVLVLLLTIGTIIVFIRWRLTALSRQAAELEKIVAERTESLAKANDALKLASNTDPLTGLRNRRFMLDQIDNLAATISRQRTKHDPQACLGFLLIDIDHFKRVNDHYGHAIGDEVLKTASKTISSCMRDEEYVLRWGGEEFLIVAPHTHHDTLPIIAERVRSAIESTECDPRITISVGFASWPLTGAPADHAWDNAVEMADHALYCAKRAGRNRCAELCLSAIPKSAWPEHIGMEQVEAWRQDGLAKVLFTNAKDLVSTP
ncbi:ligand-binding sensor domain-containing diguanylate cyclase [Shewanella sp. HN-41]|uniref:ligand-binding sensor domain-containing diguanylate cyclase n=1 Tax=Shewanella sp. HN-41 TaxID=327275 RepID=UPI0002126896|nr:ligand-binding sensor domain-containing diguanylate cyclase [Shewanella sp. HN-41]EGM68433.1 hypothetical protein SOHN41_03581 [Shewanella sp. HN-41]